MKTIVECQRQVGGVEGPNGVAGAKGSPGQMGLNGLKVCELIL